jgi:hypothetical protein
MAGRGRQSTLPAWMTADGGAGIDLSSVPASASNYQPEQGQYDDQPKNDQRGGSNGHSGGHSDSRQRSSRDDRSRKSRSRDRDHRGSRSTRSR